MPGILWGLLVMFLAGVKAKKCGYVAERRIPAKMTGIITFMIGLSSIMSWVMAFTGLPDLIANGMLSITENRYVILILMNIILLIVGTFMDPTPAVLIFTPIFLANLSDVRDASGTVWYYGHAEPLYWNNYASGWLYLVYRSEGRKCKN